MLSFRAVCLLTSIGNPTGIVRTQLKPESPVMPVPLQLTTCVGLLRAEVAVVPTTSIVGSVVAAVGDITGD